MEAKIITAVLTLVGTVWVMVNMAYNRRNIFSLISWGFLLAIIIFFAILTFFKIQL